jgi:hypothetical protein
VTLLLGVMLASSPQVLVLQRASLGVQARAAEAILADVRERAAKVGLETARVSACEKDRDCLAQAAASASLTAVGVSVASARAGITVDLEALSPTGESLATWTGTLPPKATVLPAEAEPFFAALVSKLPKPAPSIAPADVPPAIAEAPPPLRLARPLFIATGVAAAAALGFEIAGLAIHLELHPAPDSTGVVQFPFTRAQGDSLKGTANSLYTGALVFALVGAGLLASAVIALVLQ